MTRPAPEFVNCPRCGARNLVLDDLCGECTSPLLGYIGPRPRVRRVSLGTVMVLIALIAVILAPARSVPELSVLLLLVLLPTAARGLIMIEERRFDERPMTLGEKLGAFAVSFAATLLILLVTSATLVVSFALTGGLASFLPRPGVGVPAFVGWSILLAPTCAATCWAFVLCVRVFWNRPN